MLSRLNSIPFSQRIAPFFSAGARGKKTQRLINNQQFIKKIDVFIFDCDGVIW